MELQNLAFNLNGRIIEKKNNFSHCHFLWKELTGNVQV